MIGHTNYKALLILTGILFLQGMVLDSYAQYFSGQSNFNRQLDAVSLSLNSQFDFNNERLEVLLRNRNNSRFFLFNNEPRNVQKEHNATLNLRYSLYDNIALTSNVRTFTFTNTGLRQDVFMAGVAFNPLNLGQINPSLGFMRDERSNRRDEGLSWSITADLNPFTLGETSFEPKISAEVSYIDPRRFVTTRYGTKSTYRFEELFDMRSEIWFGNARRDSYQATSLLNRAESNFIESIEADTTFAAVSINFPLSQQVFAQIDAVGLNNIRRVLNYPLEDNPDVVLFDSKSLRQHLDITTTLKYPTNRFQINAGLAWSIQVRESQLINTDGLPADQVRRRAEILENSNFSQTRLELFTNNQIRFTPKYSMSLDAATSILRYDTPEVNKDNRDEFAFLFRLRNQIELTEEFTTSITLAGEAFHYVYLFSERSIENNWRRSIRLIPEIIWRPNEYLTYRQTFLVRANYTVEDYEIQGRQKADQSAREMAFISNVSYELAPTWTATVEASRSELRIGRLFWKTFEETPIDTLITYDVQTLLTKRYGNISVSSGIRYFRKFDFLQSASVQIEIDDNGSISRLSRIATGQQTTTQWGPIVQIRLPLRAGNELYINGWLQQQKSWRRLYIEYPEEYRDQFRRAERQVIRRIFPNLEMTARFRF
jgi:hypothetical protein